MTLSRRIAILDALNFKTVILKFEYKNHEWIIVNHLILIIRRYLYHYSVNSWHVDHVFVILVILCDFLACYLLLCKLPSACMPL